MQDIHRNSAGAEARESRAGADVVGVVVVVTNPYFEQVA
jgi:hypothetical protein